MLRFKLTTLHGVLVLVTSTPPPHATSTQIGQGVMCVSRAGKSTPRPVITWHGSVSDASHAHVGTVQLHASAALPDICTNIHECDHTLGC